jgi:putative membrane protein
MMWGHGWNGMGWGAMGWGGWIMMIVVVLTVWAVVALAGIAIFRGLRPRGVTAPQTADAARILDERFARGEVDGDEYTARREALRAVR